jgi:hypothetical protein
MRENVITYLYMRMRPRHTSAEQIEYKGTKMHTRHIFTEHRTMHNRKGQATPDVIHTYMCVFFVNDGRIILK